MYRRRYEKAPRRTKRALEKQEILSLERGYLSICQNSEKKTFSTQNFTEIRQSAAELWPETIFNMAAVRHFEF